MKASGSGLRVRRCGFVVRRYTDVFRKWAQYFVFPKTNVVRVISVCMIHAYTEEIIVAAWNVVGTGLWVRVYDLRGNPLNSLAIDLGDGSLAVLSPGTDLDDPDFAELDKLGRVEALVSPGAYHNLGLPAWSARYPDAGLYGPKSAIPYIAKQHPTLAPLQDLAALANKLPDDVRITEVPDMKYADAMVIIRRDDALTWFTNECITNGSELPSSLIFSLLFRLTGNKPGLNVNTLSLRFVGGKKKPLRAYLLTVLESDPPTRLIPCHGDLIDDPDLPSRMREMIDRRLH